MTTVDNPPTAAKLYTQLEPGDLLLVGARPGHGKTLMCLELAVEAMKAGHLAVFFTLEYTVDQVLDRLRAIGVDPARYTDLLQIDCDDAISAGYMIEKVASAPSGTLVVVDYLQLLDQRRENPPLSDQVTTLKSFARERGVIVVFISQIDRSFEGSDRAVPGVGDLRLPNPLDLKLFDKMWFLNNGIAELLDCWNV